MIHECERPELYRDTVIKYDGADGGGTYWQQGKSGAWINCIYYCPFCGVPLGGGHSVDVADMVRPWCQANCGLSGADHVIRSMKTCRRNCHGYKEHVMDGSAGPGYSS